MDLITEFSIDPAAVGAGLTGPDCTASPGDPAAATMSFVAALAFTPERKRGPESESGPSIECAGGLTFLRIYDRRLFSPGRETFCRALLAAAVSPGGFRRADISLESATCRLEFEPGQFDRAQVAERASAAIRAAAPRLDSRPRDRTKPDSRLTSLTAFAITQGSRPSAWEIRSTEPGRLRLRNRALWHRHRAERAAGLLRMWPGIRVCQPIGGSAELEIEFELFALSAEDVVLACEAALRVASGWQDGASGSHPPGQPTGSGTTWDALVAGGSLLLAFAGLAVPGIPSVPFFVLGCDSLCRACPQLQPWLHSLPGVGQLLRASAANENRWADPDFLAKTLILGALVAAFFLIVHPPFPLVIACELAMMLFSIH